MQVVNTSGVAEITGTEVVTIPNHGEVTLTNYASAGYWEDDYSKYTSGQLDEYGDFDQLTSAFDPFFEGYQDYDENGGALLMSWNGYYDGFRFVDFYEDRL